MKIAIMGAGMAGLSCAITLERSGITPDIFESRSQVGDRFVNAEAMFSILNRPVKDCLSYFKEKHGITFKPIDTVQKLIMHSKNETGSINGAIGYTNVRGRQKDSYENQLATQIKTPVTFNSKYSYEELCKAYDCVVLATGDGGCCGRDGWCCDRDGFCCDPYGRCCDRFGRCGYSDGYGAFPTMADMSGPAGGWYGIPGGWDMVQEYEDEY